MKFKFYIPVFLLLVTFSANASRIASKPGTETTVPMTDEQKKARLQEINQRVEEIRDMDKSNLSSEERKDLRKELKDMKKEAKAVRGVYLSIGAIIIIILLLILIL